MRLSAPHINGKTVLDHAKKRVRALVNADKAHNTSAHVACFADNGTLRSDGQLGAFGYIDVASLRNINRVLSLIHI